MICPNGAISFPGKLQVDKESPLAKAIIADLLVHQELRGFRPLVSQDEVGMVKPTAKELASHPYLILKDGVGCRVNK